MTRSDFKKHCEKIFHFLRALWEKAKPKMDKVLRAAIAISTIASTFKIALQTVPIVVSVLTVLATLPLANYLFPSFFFTTSLNSTLMFSVLGMISTFVGYSKYKELILRNELDTQTLQNKKQMNLLQNQIDDLTLKVQHLEETLLRSPLFLPSQTASNENGLPNGLDTFEPPATLETKKMTLSN